MNNNKLKLNRTKTGGNEKTYLLFFVY